MNIFRTATIFILLAHIAIPGNVGAMPSFFEKAINYVKGHPYLCAGIAIGVGSGFYVYKLYRKAQLEEISRKAAKKIADKRAREERCKKEEAEEATKQLQDFLNTSYDPHLDHPTAIGLRYDFDYTRDKFRLTNRIQWYSDLLEQGANPNTKGDRGTLLILLARIYSKFWGVEHIELCKSLIKKRADINLRDNNGMTPLMHAARLGNLGALNFLLEHGANPNMQAVRGEDSGSLTDCGETALQFVLGWEHWQFERYYEVDRIVENLLKHDADPNIQDRDGRTALMIAADHGLSNSVLLLLKHEANIELKNKNGFTAIDIAKKKGKQEIVDLITSYRNFKTIENDQTMLTSRLPNDVKREVWKHILKSDGK